MAEQNWGGRPSTEPKKKLRYVIYAIYHIGNKRNLEPFLTITR